MPSRPLVGVATETAQHRKVSNMAQVIFTADIHLGLVGKLQHTIWALKVLRAYAQRTGISTVVILGDFFHDRATMGIDVINAVFDFLEETKNEYGQTWITFPGNHDMFLRHSWDLSSIRPLRHYMTVIETVKILKLNDVRFWVLPFITYEKSYMEVLKAIEKQYQPGDKLLTHIGVRGSELNSCFTLKDFNFVDFTLSPFDRIYTGHYHLQQQVGENLWYPGSLLPHNHSEGNAPHGFYVYNLEENSHKFINIFKAGAKLLPTDDPPPEYFTIDSEEVSSVSEEKVKNNCIRIAVFKQLSFDERQGMIHHLRTLGAKSVSMMNRVQEDDADKAITAKSRLRETHANADLFGAWVKMDGERIKGLDLKVLERCNMDVVTEGDELYALEESETID